MLDRGDEVGLVGTNQDQGSCILEGLDWQHGQVAVLLLLESVHWVGLVGQAKTGCGEGLCDEEAGLGLSCWGDVEGHRSNFHGTGALG